MPCLQHLVFHPFVHDFPTIKVSDTGMTVNIDADNHISTVATKHLVTAPEPKNTEPTRDQSVPR